MAGRRGELLRRAQGRVVEIGAGTGLNVVHYPAMAEVVLVRNFPRSLLRPRGPAS